MPFPSVYNKTKKKLPLDEVEQIIKSANPWVKLIANTKEDSSKYLTLLLLAVHFEVPIGRLHKMNLGSGFLQCLFCRRSTTLGCSGTLKKNAHHFAWLEAIYFLYGL